MENEKQIARLLSLIEESYFYLQILKNRPLMEAKESFGTAFKNILDLCEKIWTDHKDHPSREQLFIEIGEDYNAIKDLLHANDALNPIHDGLQEVFAYMRRFRDAGISAEEARERLQTIKMNG